MRISIRIHPLVRDPLVKESCLLLVCSINRLGITVLLCVSHKIEERNKQIASWVIISVLERRMREINTPAPFSGRVAQLKHRVNSCVDNAFIIFFSLFLF